VISPVATTVVLRAVQAESPEEFVSFLIGHYLFGSPDSERPVFSDIDKRRFQAAIGEEGDIGAGIVLLGELVQHFDRRGQSYGLAVCSAMAVAGRDFEMSADFLMEAVKIPLHERDAVWWAAHAALLGLCVCAARIPPESLSPFSTATNAVPSRHVIAYIGTYGKFVQEALGRSEFREKRALLEPFGYAAEALYRAVDFTPSRAGTMQRLRDQMMQRVLEQSDSDFWEKNRRDPAVEFAALVDSLTDHCWNFASAVRDIGEAWSRAYARM
jgi:hypothetical protein